MPRSHSYVRLGPYDILGCASPRRKRPISSLCRLDRISRKRPSRPHSTQLLDGSFLLSTASPTSLLNQERLYPFFYALCGGEARFRSGCPFSYFSIKDGALGEGLHAVPGEETHDHFTRCSPPSGRQNRSADKRTLSDFLRDSAKPQKSRTSRA